MFANIELGTIYDDVPTIDPVDYTDVVVDGIVGVLSEYYLTNDNLVRVIDKFHAPCLFLNDINSVAADAASYMFAVDKWSPFKVPNSLLNLYNADEGTTTSITPDCSASYVLLPRQRLVAAMLTAFMVYSVGRSMLMLMPYAVTYGKYALALIPNPSDSVHFLRWTYSFCPHTVHAECDPLDHDHFTAVHWSLRCSPMFQQAMKVVTDPLSCAWGLVLHSSTWSTFGHNLLACAVFAAITALRLLIIVMVGVWLLVISILPGTFAAFLLQPTWLGASSYLRDALCIYHKMASYKVRVEPRDLPHQPIEVPYECSLLKYHQMTQRAPRTFRYGPVGSRLTPNYTRESTALVGIFHESWLVPYVGLTTRNYNIVSVKHYVISSSAATPWFILPDALNFVEARLWVRVLGCGFVFNDMPEGKINAHVKNLVTQRAEEVTRMDLDDEAHVSPGDVNRFHQKRTLMSESATRLVSKRLNWLTWLPVRFGGYVGYWFGLYWYLASSLLDIATSGILGDNFTESDNIARGYSTDVRSAEYSPDEYVSVDFYELRAHTAPCVSPVYPLGLNPILRFEVACGHMLASLMHKLVFVLPRMLFALLKREVRMAKARIDPAAHVVLIDELEPSYKLSRLVLDVLNPQSECYYTAIGYWLPKVFGAAKACCNAVGHNQGDVLPSDMLDYVLRDGRGVLFDDSERTLFYTGSANPLDYVCVLQGHVYGTTIRGVFNHLGVDKHYKLGLSCSDMTAAMPRVSVENGSLKCFDLAYEALGTADLYVVGAAPARWASALHAIMNDPGAIIAQPGRKIVTVDPYNSLCHTARPFVEHTRDPRFMPPGDIKVGSSFYVDSFVPDRFPVAVAAHDAYMRELGVALARGNLKAVYKLPYRTDVVRRRFVRQGYVVSDCRYHDEVGERVYANGALAGVMHNSPWFDACTCSRCSQLRIALTRVKAFDAFHYMLSQPNPKRYDEHYADDESTLKVIKRGLSCGDAPVLTFAGVFDADLGFFHQERRLLPGRVVNDDYEFFYNSEPVPDGEAVIEADTIEIVLAVDTLTYYASPVWGRVPRFAMHGAQRYELHACSRDGEDVLSPRDTDMEQACGRGLRVDYDLFMILVAELVPQVGVLIPAVQGQAGQDDGQAPLPQLREQAPQPQVIVGPPQAPRDGFVVVHAQAGQGDEQGLPPPPPPPEPPQGDDPDDGSGEPEDGGDSDDGDEGEQPDHVRAALEALQRARQVPGGDYFNEAARLLAQRPDNVIAPNVQQPFQPVAPLAPQQAAAPLPPPPVPRVEQPAPNRILQPQLPPPALPEQQPGDNPALAPRAPAPVVAQYRVPARRAEAVARAGRPVRQQPGQRAAQPLRREANDRPPRANREPLVRSLVPVFMAGEVRVMLFDADNYTRLRREHGAAVGAHKLDLFRGMTACVTQFRNVTEHNRLMFETVYDPAHDYEQAVQAYAQARDAKPDPAAIYIGALNAAHAALGIVDGTTVPDAVAIEEVDIAINDQFYYRYATAVRARKVADGGDVNWGVFAGVVTDLIQHLGLGHVNVDMDCFLGGPGASKSRIMNTVLKRLINAGSKPLLVTIAADKASGEREELPEACASVEGALNNITRAITSGRHYSHMLFDEVFALGYEPLCILMLYCQKFGVEMICGGDPTQPITFGEGDAPRITLLHRALIRRARLTNTVSHTMPPNVCDAHNEWVASLEAFDGTGLSRMTTLAPNVARFVHHMDFAQAAEQPGTTIVLTREERRAVQGSLTMMMFQGGRDANMVLASRGDQAAQRVNDSNALAKGSYVATACTRLDGRRECTMRTFGNIPETVGFSRLIPLAAWSYGAPDSNTSYHTMISAGCSSGMVNSVTTRARVTGVATQRISRAVKTVHAVVPDMVCEPFYSTQRVRMDAAVPLRTKNLDLESAAALMKDSFGDSSDIAYARRHAALVAASDALSGMQKDVSITETNFKLRRKERSFLAMSDCRTNHQSGGEHAFAMGTFHARLDNHNETNEVGVDKNKHFAEALAEAMMSPGGKQLPELAEFSKRLDHLKPLLGMNLLRAFATKTSSDFEFAETMDDENIVNTVGAWSMAELGRLLRDTRKNVGVKQQAKLSDEKPHVDWEATYKLVCEVIDEVKAGGDRDLAYKRLTAELLKFGQGIFSNDPYRFIACFEFSMHIAMRSACVAELLRLYGCVQGVQAGKTTHDILSEMAHKFTGKCVEFDIDQQDSKRTMLVFFFARKVFMSMRGCTVDEFEDIMIREAGVHGSVPGAGIKMRALWVYVWKTLSGFLDTLWGNTNENCLISVLLDNFKTHAGVSIYDMVELSVDLDAARIIVDNEFEFVTKEPYKIGVGDDSLSELLFSQADYDDRVSRLVGWRSLKLCYREADEPKRFCHAIIHRDVVCKSLVRCALKALVKGYSSDRKTASMEFADYKRSVIAWAQAASDERCVAANIAYHGRGIGVHKLELCQSFLIAFATATWSETYHCLKPFTILNHK